MDWMSIFSQIPGFLGSAISNPAAAADMAATAGVPPPPMPPGGGGMVDPSQNKTMPDIGASLNPLGPGVDTGGAPMGAAPLMGGPAAAGLAAAATGQTVAPGPISVAGLGDSFKNGMAGLAGMAKPQVPTPQRVSTPAAVRPTTQIKQGELMQLLGALGLLGSQDTGGGYKLPSTLGSALGGGGR